MSIVDIADGNPLGTPSPCLGKRRYEAQAAVEASTAYFCIFCDGWHGSEHGYSGRRRVSRKRHGRRAFAKGNGRRRP